MAVQIRVDARQMPGEGRKERDEADMAGSFHKIMAYLGLVDDYDDYDELSERGRPAPTRSAPPRPARPEPRPREREREYAEDDRYDAYEQPRAPMGTVSRIRPVSRNGDPSSLGASATTPRPKVVPLAPAEGRPFVVAPRQFGDAREIGEHMRQSTPVIVNLQQADRELQRRMIDFCAGVAAGLKCHMERVADQVFLLTPTNVTVSEEERARLESRGFNN